MTDKKNTPAPGENEDDFCDLEPGKHCDNCMKCIIGDKDFNSIQITGIQLNEEE